MSSTKRRLVASFMANIFGRLSTTIIQIVSVPIYLSHWGAHLYGEWLLLSTIPTYFSLSDIGLGSVAGNEMTMLAAAGKLDEALEVFQSVWIVTTTCSSIAGLLLFGLIWFIPLDRWLHIQQLSVVDVRIVILFLGLSTLLTMQETLFQACFRCVGRYAYGTSMKTTFTLSSFMLILVPVMLGFSARWVAFTYMLVNAVGTLVLWFLLRREIKWIKFGVKYARRSAVKRLVSPAVAMLSVPFANSLNLQGILIVIGSILGPTAVVTFSTARTISRSAYQVMQLVNNSVWPEVSAAFGARNMELARKLHRHACQLSIFLCCCVTLTVAVFGKYVWKLWTIGKVPTDPVLLNIMLAQLVVSSLWFTSSVIPISINKHQTMARVLVVSSVVSLLLAAGLMKVPALELRGAALGLVIGDAINAFYILRISLRLLDDHLGDFVRSMFTLPRLRMSRSKVAA
ncbi:lipopolysaccharide biosynthesis protein [Alloacidobacterium dinghuense]|uniref:Lipopolysaccharide biosynthesis protein n=1 Tax=Alloacidobacterium dinghuense TaxID=2763107 RepID=A0A7G8BLD5_9BACT|nr:lipopolysaccharide biosynthesis protein [Alloacidobacterium dinghuense]QNI33355.1 lipopolysaccharide biosynthesis protein [Alloacidobacterium dinghuense]